MKKPHEERRDVTQCAQPPCAYPLDTDYHAAMTELEVRDAGNGAREGFLTVRRSRLGKLLRASIFGILGIGVTFGLGFGLFADYISRLATPTNPPAADAIIVLTGGQARIDAAVNLLKSGKGKRLLISGVNPVASRKSLQRATGGDNALFNCCVDIDRAALDTIGNAEESAKWVRDHDYSSVILVTNNYHMPRSLLEMGRLIDKVQLQPYPVVNSRLDGGTWMTNKAALRVILTEYTKYLGALARAVVPLRSLPDGTIMVDATTTATTR